MGSAQIKAIETRYKGYRFRSRLEARWAVFFDALGISWEYEPEGFDLGPAGYYLPDFKLKLPSGLVTWCEIKPEGSPRDPKLSKFNDLLVSPVDGSFVEFGQQLSGDPYSVLSSAEMCPRCGEIDRHGGWLDDYGAEIGITCERCDLTTPCGHSDSEYGLLGVELTPHKGVLIISKPDYFRFENAVNRAAIKARSARFEHGEVGAAFA